MMRARGTISVGGLHHATRSRVRAYEECPESDSAVCRDVRPDGQERPCQEASDDANWANKGSSKSSGASWAASPRLTGSRQLTCVRFISGLRVMCGDAQNDASPPLSPKGGHPRAAKELSQSPYPNFLSHAQESFVTQFCASASVAKPGTSISRREPFHHPTSYQMREPFLVGSRS
jgi:hypothetical protein